MDTLFALRLAEEQSLQRTIVRFMRGLRASEPKREEPPSASPSEPVRRAPR
jgi:hypothetical protein